MSDAHEFLVSIEIDTGDLPDDQRELLRARESRRAAELAAEGHLRALWRVSGRWANRGLWRAESEAHLRDLLDSLPLRPYMTLVIEPIEEHPSDPGERAPSSLPCPS